MGARIYRPAKTAMQSGEGRTKNWVLEYEPESARSIEPLMGWTSSGDQKSQIRVKFATKEEAVDYAKKQGIAYTLTEPHTRKRKPKAYADNFRTSRAQPWTH